MKKWFEIQEKLIVRFPDKFKGGRELTRGEHFNAEVGIDYINHAADCQNYVVYRRPPVWLENKL
jgi:hypothetical protein